MSFISTLYYLVVSFQAPLFEYLHCLLFPAMAEGTAVHNNPFPIGSREVVSFDAFRHARKPVLTVVRVPCNYEADGDQGGCNPAGYCASDYSSVL